MRHSSLLLPILIVIGVSLGGILYLFGVDRFASQRPTTDSAPAVPAGSEPFAVIETGDDALGIERRVNYRIGNQTEYDMLWDMMFNGAGGRPPPVNFSREEVFAIFDGTRSTTGFQVRVAAITDAEGVRTVSIVREAPAEDCAVTSEIRSPYVLVRVERSPLPITRQESTATSTCYR